MSTAAFPAGHGQLRSIIPHPPAMAGRLLPPDTSPALGVEDVPRLLPALQVSPQHRVSGAGPCWGIRGHPNPLCQPLPVPQVPVIRHRGSNTLNFHFHEPESRGTAQNSQGAPKSSGTESPEHAGDIPRAVPT